MKTRLMFLLGPLLLLASATARAANEPNIVLLLADDLGWTGTSVQMDERIEDSRSGADSHPARQPQAHPRARFRAGVSL